LQRWWIDWFKQANLLAKYADAASIIRSKEMAAGSGMYPRDVLLKAMRGRLYNWVDQDGWRWYSMAAVGDISESLDVLAQSIGSLLVRAADRWRTVPPGNPGDVLTHQAADEPPVWLPGGGGGGAFAGALVRNLANQSIPNSTTVAVAFTAELYDTDDIHDNATNNTRLTVPADWVKARLTASVHWTSASAASRYLAIKRNGSDFDGGARDFRSGVFSAYTVISTPVIAVTPGQFFEMMVWHNIGGALSVIGPSGATYFAIERVE